MEDGNFMEKVEVGEGWNEILDEADVQAEKVESVSEVWDGFGVDRRGGNVTEVRDDDVDALVDWLRRSVGDVSDSRKRELEERRPGLLDRFVSGDILGVTEYEGMSPYGADVDGTRRVSVMRKSERRLGGY